MKKLLALLALGTFALAGDAERIIAVEYGSNTGTSTVSSVSTTGTGTAIGLKLGAKEDQMRLFLSYRYNQDEQYAGIELDFFTPDMGPFALYVGAVGGYATISDTSMPYYGAEGGLTLTFGHFGIDAGARLSILNYELSSTTTINDMTTYYGAIHYIY